MPNIRELITVATHRLALSGVATPHLDAEVLLANAIGQNRTYIFTNGTAPITKQHQEKYASFLKRRSDREPVAYIVGEKEFWSLPFKVNRSVLIPRPETELLVEKAIAITQNNTDNDIRILEIGTGSGAISCALANELKNCRITATDISPVALEIAIQNACALNVADKINFVESDIFEAVNSVFDMIISNPPYIAATEYANLMRDVKDYEPKEALIAGNDGMCFYRAIIRQAHEFLTANGWLVMEIGAQQKTNIAEIFEASGRYEEVKFYKDGFNDWRVVKAKKKE